VQSGGHLLLFVSTFDRRIHTLFACRNHLDLRLHQRAGIHLGHIANLQRFELHVQQSDSFGIIYVVPGCDWDDSHHLGEYCSGWV
jgi:hypothetical protein